jgi:glucosamine-6-phosphate deaminase
MTTGPTYPIAVSVHPTRAALGHAAGALAARHLREALEQRPRATVMLAAAPSQAATLSALATEPDVEWSRVTAFHMDDYLGLDPEAPQGFGTWLERSFVSRVPSMTFHRMSVAGDPQVDAEAYAARLPEGPFDLVLLGLGVNGHLAFNDPPAQFDDPQDTRVVELDDVSRQQQVDEGHFATIEDVPRRAITVTIPRLLRAQHVVASVPGTEKRDAVRAALTAPIGPDHPGTALRTHPDVALFLDEESAPR